MMWHRQGRIAACCSWGGNSSTCRQGAARLPGCWRAPLRSLMISQGEPPQAALPWPNSQQATPASWPLARVGPQRSRPRHQSSGRRASCCLLARLLRPALTLTQLDH